MRRTAIAVGLYMDADFMIMQSIEPILEKLVRASAAKYWLAWCVLRAVGG